MYAALMHIASETVRGKPPLTPVWIVCTCFNDFPGMIARVFQHLTPNGWAEFHDFAFELVGEDEAAETLLQGSAIAQLFRCAISGGAAKGKDFESGRKLKGWMIEAGFVDVVQRQIFLPLNAWPLDRKDNLIGKWWSLDLLKALDGLTKLVATAGMPLEEIPDFTDRVRLDITNRNMRVYAIGKLRDSPTRLPNALGLRL